MNGEAGASRRSFIRLTASDIALRAVLLCGFSTASIIALSKYDTWSANNEDPSDSFKKDGLNYRKVDLLIDGVPHTATVVTALNGDPKQRLDYGEKFYDIENIIEKQTNLSASYGTLVNRATPHIIKMADGSSDRLTVTQKQRIVNNKKSTYSSSGGAAKTATAIALEKALAQNPQALRLGR